jgi:hypothetical protein
MMDSTTLGGGGGYINFDLSIPSSDDTSARVCPSKPVVVALSHESAAFTWSAGSHQYETSKEFYVQKYVVSLSTSTVSRSDEAGDGIRCSGAFTVHEHIQRGFDMNRNATTKLNSLEASTSYCLHIEALSSRGLSLGKQIFIFHTKSMPINEWLPVPVLQLSDASTTVLEISVSGGDTDDNESTTTIWCKHSPTRPTGRRGHSMTIVNDEVYVFGGATLKCVCEGPRHAAEEKCSSKNVFSNELWHFDPLTSTFTELGHDSGVNEVNSWPSGREQHSMTALPNGDLVLIGGRTSTNEYFEIGEESEQVLLTDVWTMRDPYHIISSLGFSSDVLGAALPIELIPGHVTSHRMPIALHDGNDVDGELFGHEDLCTRDIQVQISLDRICPNDIEYIMLTAPSKTLTSANHDTPQSIVHETKV